MFNTGLNISQIKESPWKPDSVRAGVAPVANMISRGFLLFGEEGMRKKRDRREYNKKYRQENIEQISKREKAYRLANKERRREDNKRWRKENPEYNKNWRLANTTRGERKEYHKKYRQENREKIREYQRRKYRNNPEYGLGSSILWAIRKQIKNNNSGFAANWQKWVGYSVEQLVEHIENKFLGGMTWENRGEWHVDHIIPISAFNFTAVSDIDFRRCWALSNLQPLWAEDNMSKGSKLDKPFQPSLCVSAGGS